MLIISDVDGVVADFVSGALSVHRRQDYQVKAYDWFVEDWGMTPEQFWGPIRNEGQTFYQHHVPQYPWTLEYLMLIQQYGPVVLATDNPADPGLSASKTRWLNDFLWGLDTFVTMRGTRNLGKELLASPDRILIDDSDGNVKKFREHNGHAVLFPQPWNGARDHTNRRMDYLRNNLDDIFSSIGDSE
jgi:hypothetical protein